MVDAIVARDDKEVSRRQRQDLAVREGLPERHVLAGGVLGLLSGQFILERLALVVLEPSGLGRSVGQEEQDEDAQDDCRNTPEDIGPLPARQTGDPGMVDQDAVDRLVGPDPEQEVREFRANQLRERTGHEEVSQCPRSVTLGKPVGQVDDHAGIETGLGQPEQESDRVEMPGLGHQRSQGGEDPPGDHDPADPLPGTPALDDQRSRDLQEAIAGEEDPHPEAEDVVIEIRQIPDHLQLEDRDV
jgi:hypothetical protein